MKIFPIILLMSLVFVSNNYTQDFWEKTTGFDSLAIYSLAINSSGDIFAGCDTSFGLFRSTDHGDNWSNLGLTNLRTTGIVIKPNAEILLITLDHQNGGGVFNSTDNGNSWTNKGFTLAGNAIAINSSGDIFVATIAAGVYRSTDNGVNFVPINQGLTNLNPTSLVINSSGDIFAGTISGGVFRSTDNGNNWTQINQGITNNYILSLGINTNGDIIAGTSGGGAFRSTDNGNNWFQINQGLTGEGSYIRSLAINSDGDIFAGTADGIFQSTDNGENWVQINQGLTNILFDNLYGLSLAINSNGNIFAGTDGGIFRSFISTNVKVFLQGPYSGGSMTTTLRNNGYIPLTHPYNTAPFSYNGTEAVDTIPAGIVDWVLLELRSDLTTQVLRRAAFLKSDGSLVDLDGISNVKFSTIPEGDYYLVIRHRNHLAVMTANKVNISLNPILYDMRTDLSDAYGTNALKDLGGGSFGMWMGDVNSDGIVKYNLGSNDRLLIYNRIGNAGFNVTVSGYYNEDVNMDGIVKYNLSNNDRLFIYNVLGNGGFNTTKSTQVPN